MALSPIDDDLLNRLLGGDGSAWSAFVDRFLGLITHVVSHTADCRGVTLTAADREDLIADVLVVVLQDDAAVLRRFERRSSLATYLAVIARRVVVRRMMQLAGVTPVAADTIAMTPDGDPPVEQRVADQDQVEQMLGGLPEGEARVVRLFHLEGRSYGEISHATGVPVNTIGPVLSRARAKLRSSTEA